MVVGWLFQLNSLKWKMTGYIHPLNGKISCQFPCFSLLILILFFSFDDMKSPGRLLYRLLLLSICTSPGYIFSQHALITLPYSRYTVANGLAQMQVRSIYVDKDGLAWIGTQGGISVYDGNEIREIHKPGPLSEKYLVSLARGSEKLFISTHTENFEFNGYEVVPLDYLPGFPPDTYVQFEDQNHFAWYACGTKWWLKDRNNKLHSPESIYPTLKNLNIRGAWGNPYQEECFFTDTENRFYVFNSHNGEMHIDSQTLAPSDNIRFSGNHSPDQNNIVFQKIDADQQTVLDLYKISGANLVHVAATDPFDGKLHAISPVAPLSYVGRYQGVNHLFIQLDSIYEPDAVPTFNSIRFVVEAFHKLFVSTDEGLIVIHCEGLENVIYPQCDYSWSVVPGKDDHLFLGCYKSGVHHLDASGKLIKNFILPAFMRPGALGDQIMTNYLVTPQAILFGSNAGFIALKNEKTELDHIACKTSIEALALDPLEGSIIAADTRLNWFDRDLSRLVDSMALPEELLSGAFVNDMFMTEDRKLWIAAPGGIMCTDLNTRSIRLYTEHENTLPCGGAVTIEAGEKGDLWSGGTCGLMKLRQGTTQFISILPDIIHHRVNQVELLPGNLLVCASNNNLFMLDISNDHANIVSIYNQSNGLNLFEPSENGSSLTRNRYVWFPSVAGIQRLDLKRVPTKRFPAKLNVIEINNLPVRMIKSRIDTIVTNGAAALLGLSLIDYSGKTWQFQFSLNNGPFSPWQNTKELLVSGLRHGYNHVLIRGTWNSTNPLDDVDTQVVVKSHLPFLSRAYVQWSMVILSVILVLLMTAAIIRSQRSMQREHLLRSDLYRNRLKTIQAYLNPHFLFNTLTSIQDRILQQDAKAGNDLIIRLSRVFRKVLDTGKSADHKIPMIHLSEEMDLINDMVYLNNAQLAIPVSITVEIDPAVEERDPLIPPLMIQPFVENTFKHAFSIDETDKSVQIKVSTERNILVVRIIDNGSGYERSQVSTNSTSMGSSLASERMAILNQLNIENSITVMDEKPHGTVVEIKIRLDP